MRISDGGRSPEAERARSEAVSRGTVPDLEICVDESCGLTAAQRPCVARIELCAALAQGGLTPSPGLIARAGGSSVPVFALIRPRAGDFIYSDMETDQMLDDIAHMRQAGLAGVVIGCLDAEGRLDRARLARLRRASLPLRCQLHRAIDLSVDPLQAIDIAIDLGFERVLSSGGARSAAEGAACLGRMMEHARGRIEIMAGGGVRPDNVAEIYRTSGVNGFHASCRIACRVQDDRLDHFGFAARRGVTSAGEILRLSDALCALAAA
ncbi:copper homeostasis protein CutC [Swaminathania salitolerans]|uniref:PF03932 family protein CutC n=1 Tax=Swaminathania salitolerans TaxID=182838 RepID=A0A511BNG9_9PROT|nr:copper homeostasis protein CutC [Swaminathania salitolerans]GBQ10196.1 copper homeostasis protein CutC [Swaminathania salitolerans LMG 21291]GEL01204.1 copper homeostasis protein CutC [Swaminathania salitolerans]